MNKISSVIAIAFFFSTHIGFHYQSSVCCVPFQIFLPPHFASHELHVHLGPCHLRIAPPQDNPAPKPAAAMTSPRLISPSRTASSKAMGMDPAEVFPYCSEQRT